MTQNDWLMVAGGAVIGYLAMRYAGRKPSWEQWIEIGLLVLVGAIILYMAGLM